MIYNILERGQNIKDVANKVERSGTTSIAI